MEANVEGAKTKALAVFENVVTKERQKKRKRFKPSRFSDESSQSESELVIVEEDKKEISRRNLSEGRFRLKQEPLRITCEWDDCTEIFSTEHNLHEHFVVHVEQYEGGTCKWTSCPNPEGLHNKAYLMRHLSYHGYLAKLTNIGFNVLARNDYPECSLAKKYTISIPTQGYQCEWKECVLPNTTINTIYEYLAHVQSHTLEMPTGKVMSETDPINCLWKGCTNVEFSTRYKLAEHLKTHTKERVIACPHCFSVFSSKTTFADHRKRQLKTDMRSYQCSQCLKLFSVEKLLTDHMRVHINHYKCTMCDMTSPKPSMLAKHYQFRHLNMRPFKCQVCQKSFVTKSNLNTHMWTHTKNQFTCDQCDFGCKSNVGLKSHMVKVHGFEATIYECQVCKRKLSRGDTLTYHLTRKHNFHWPPGHCRFRYRKDSDGICRLQTVRYESLEVTEQMMKGESTKETDNTKKNYEAVVSMDMNGEYKLFFVPYNENIAEVTDQIKEDSKPEIIMTIEDLDERGNVVKSTEIPNHLYQKGDTSNLKVIGYRDMPTFESEDSDWDE